MYGIHFVQGTRLIKWAFHTLTTFFSCNHVSAYGRENININRNLKQIASREVSCYSISAKNQVNIDITLQWLIKKGK